MSNVVFVTGREEFRQDLYVASMVSTSFKNTYIFCPPEKLDEIVANNKPDEIVVSYDVLKTKVKWSKYKGVKIVTHAWNREELEKCEEYPFDTIGMSDDSEETLKALERGPRASRAGQRKKPDTDSTSGNKKITTGQKAESKRTEKQKTPEPNIPEEDVDTDGLFDDSWEENDLSDGTDEPDDDFDGLPDLSNDFSSKKEESDRETQVYEQSPEDEPDDDFIDPYDFSFDEKEEEDAKPEHTEKIENNRNETGNREEDDDYPSDEEADAQIDAEVHPHKYSKTKTVSVCSAKGGVGKTTIASELAVYLSHVTVGNRYLRVCLVDCNIDFGDVRLTLKLSQKGPTMTTWSEEIKERIENGEKPGKIRYSKEEIERRLRKYEKDFGLWVLPAPLTNEDSMSIESEEIEIILNNLIDNGQFDYIICDTGNNTRDSVLIPLEKSDVILMIMTQNRNTANCDKSFLSTMEAIDFDTGKVKLVMNCLMNDKKTKISEDDIEAHFKGLECVGKIRFSMDVIKATNEGRPLSLDPDNPFTKEMRQIVSYLTGINEEIVPEKKQGFFGRLFGKKK